MRVAAGVEYCGTAFDGWQKQPGRRTVQGCVEAAVASVADHPVEVHCAGRTDAGVHAVRQVIHFDTSSERQPHSWVLGINSCLPRDINVLWAVPVQDDFHSRFSAISRSYNYLILNRPMRTGLYDRMLTWERRRLDVVKMSEAAADLVGEHDFTSYRAISCQSKTPVRDVRKLIVIREGDLVVIDIEANAFLHHMVRNIAGVLIMIGMGKQQPGWAKQVLDAKDRTLGGITAPPDGLYLVSVRYDGKFGIPGDDVGPGVVDLFNTLSGQE